VTGLLAFALFNSSDVFLLLKAKEAGLSDTMVIGVYIFYNLIYALSAFPLGIVADKIGLKKMYVFGLSIFAIVYFGMSISSNIFVIAGLFFLYGVYASATEGISKAWISNISLKKDTATGIGTYSAFQSICSMLASSFAGFIWYQFGASATFIITGVTTLLIIIYFSFWIKNNPHPLKQMET
jgi:MFS family permease